MQKDMGKTGPDLIAMEEVVDDTECRLIIRRRKA